MDCGCPVPSAGIYFCISEVAPDEERTVCIIPVPPPVPVLFAGSIHLVTSCSSIITGYGLVR